MLSPAEIVRKKRKLRKTVHEKNNTENERSYMKKMVHHTHTTRADELKKINTSPPFYASPEFSVDEEITQIQDYSDTIDKSYKQSSSSNVQSYQKSKTKKPPLSSPPATVGSSLKTNQPYLHSSTAAAASS